MKIRFVKQHLDNKKDSVIEVTAERGWYLIAVGVAVKNIVKDKK